MNKQALGKGLSALIPEKKAFEEKEEIIHIDVTLIKPSKYQPREIFDENKLEELVHSIKERGVFQPILVRSIKNGEYELIAGERRWRATKEAGLSKIPCVIKEVNDEELIELSLIENLQRENLNPIEEAKAYSLLIQNFNLTQELLAKRVGKNRSSIANSLRLLKLPVEIQEYVSRETISQGHAITLLSLEEKIQQIELCKKIIQQGFSVREAENWARRIKKRRIAGKKNFRAKDSYMAKLEEELKKKLGTQVKIKRGSKKSILEIEFYSDDDLERIINLLKL